MPKPTIAFLICSLIGASACELDDVDVGVVDASVLEAVEGGGSGGGCCPVVVVDTSEAPACGEPHAVCVQERECSVDVKLIPASERCEPPRTRHGGGEPQTEAECVQNAEIAHAICLKPRDGEACTAKPLCDGEYTMALADCQDRFPAFEPSDKTECIMNSFQGI